jgi:hypothetical protein
VNIFGVFRMKNHDFTPKNHIFSNFRGGARRVRNPPPLGSALVLHKVSYHVHIQADQIVHIDQLLKVMNC